jgi:hypothetical protein
MTQAESEIRALAEKRHLPAAHLERWIGTDADSRDAIMEFARTLGLRTGQIVEALDLLDEISVRERAEIAGVLARPALARLLTSAGSRPDRARDFVAELRRMRYPRLAELSRRLDSEIAALKLSASIRVVLPPRLGSDELTLQITVSSAGALDRALETISNRRESIARIIEMLGGKDEV